MAKASDNIYPLVRLAPGAAPASPAAGQQVLYLDSADSNKLKRKDSSGTVTTVEGSGGSGGLLAYTYAATGSFQTASTTVVDADATLTVTFTAPTSGKVLVRLTAFTQTMSSGNMTAQSYIWAIREGTTQLASESVFYNQSGGPVTRSSVPMALTGLTAGSHTFKWAHYVSGGIGGRMDGGFMMEVHALP